MKFRDRIISAYISEGETIIRIREYRFETWLRDREYKAITPASLERLATLAQLDRENLKKGALL